MDYYQGVVNEYLRANRATFINTEYCIQLSQGNKGLTKGSHWYCDAVALSFTENKIYLCEVSFAKSLQALQKRLLAWSAHWDEVKTAIRREGDFKDDLHSWDIQPWLFIPKEMIVNENGDKPWKAWEDKAGLKFKCKVTALEDTAPWKFRLWDKKIDEDSSVAL